MANDVRGMIIDGVIASEAVDSSGEILSVKGCDTSSMEVDGVLNYEHKSDTDAGASFNDIIGKCILCKKIYEREDCSNDRERMYWDEVKLPFIYGQFRLFDEAGHPGAVAAAAIIRDQHEAGEKLILRFSIEGSTLEKDGNVLKTSIARRCALTAKPCNKTAITGMLKDSKKSALDEFVEEDAKKFEDHPNYQHLGEGGAVVGVLGTDLAESIRVSLDKLKKTMMAGSYNAAPGTLTGGAALQREDLHGVHNLAAIKSAVRDWAGDGGPEKLKSLLKFYMPEASDEFMDLFAQRANEWTVKKREQFLGKKEEKPPKPPPAPAPADVPAKEGGTKVPKKRNNTEVLFDPQSGTLHTTKFSAQVYNPAGPMHQNYEDALHDHHVNRIHDEAMRHWVILHRLARGGTLAKHPDIIAHAALFSAMSPNTAVPVQELAYGFLMDMKQRGWDPTQHLDEQKGAQWKEEFQRFMRGEMLPQWGRDHFARRDAGIWSSQDQKDWMKDKETGEKIHVPRMHWTGQNPDEGEWKDYPKTAGSRVDVGLAEQKAQGALAYADMHGLLSGLISQHGVDGRAIAGRLNAIKQDNIRERQRVYNAGRAGRVVESRINPDDPDVNGFAPKTIRYTLGMLGLGNIAVPDTHFIRHTFGLPLKDSRNDAIKQVLWDPKNEHVLAGLDDWYYRNHPAVQYTRQKLKEQYGEDFGEHSIFPGFWLHWLTIEPHERMRNWDTRAKNAGTDHSVYFNSIYRMLDQYGIPYRHLAKNEDHEGNSDGSLAARCAHVTKALELSHGETPATIAYYAFLAPALLGHTQQMQKAEKLKNRLKKAMEEKPQQPTETPRSWQGGYVYPGVLRHKDGNAYHLLGMDDKAHYFESPNGLRHSVPNQLIGQYYTVQSVPRKVTTPSIIDADKHALPGAAQHEEQRALIHGMDFSDGGIVGRGASGVHMHVSFFRKNPTNGAVGWVKPGDDEPWFATSGERPFSTSEREAAFYNLAKGYFGLGHYVPPTSAVKHPITGKLHSVQQALSGAEHYSNKRDDHAATLMRLGTTGELEKLGVMDTILGQDDRHDGNFMVSGAEPNLHLIDNGFTFAGEGHTRGPQWFPSYLNSYYKLRGGTNYEQPPMHPAATQWLMDLDPNALEQKMHTLSIPEHFRKEAVRRLVAMQNKARSGPHSFWDLHYAHVAKGY